MPAYDAGGVQPGGTAPNVTNPVQNAINSAQNTLLNFQSLTATNPVGSGVGGALFPTTSPYAGLLNSFATQYQQQTGMTLGQPAIQLLNEGARQAQEAGGLAPLTQAMQGLAAGQKVRRKVKPPSSTQAMQGLATQARATLQPAQPGGTAPNVTNPVGSGVGGALFPTTSPYAGLLNSFATQYQQQTGMTLGQPAIQLLNEGARQAQGAGDLAPLTQAMQGLATQARATLQPAQSGATATPPPAAPQGQVQLPVNASQWQDAAKWVGDKIFSPTGKALLTTALNGAVPGLGSLAASGAVAIGNAIYQSKVNGRKIDAQNMTSDALAKLLVEFGAGGLADFITQNPAAQAALKALLGKALEDPAQYGADAALNALLSGSGSGGNSGTTSPPVTFTPVPPPSPPGSQAVSTTSPPSPPGPSPTPVPMPNPWDSQVSTAGPPSPPGQSQPGPIDQTTRSADTVTAGAGTGAERVMNIFSPLGTSTGDAGDAGGAFNPSFYAQQELLTQLRNLSGAQTGGFQSPGTEAAYQSALNQLLGLTSAEADRGAEPPNVTGQGTNALRGVQEVVNAGLGGNLVNYGGSTGQTDAAYQYALQQLQFPQGQTEPNIAPVQTTEQNLPVNVGQLQGASQNPNLMAALNTLMGGAAPQNVAASGLLAAASQSADAIQNQALQTGQAPLDIAQQGLPQETQQALQRLVGGGAGSGLVGGVFPSDAPMSALLNSFALQYEQQTGARLTPQQTTYLSQMAQSGDSANVASAFQTLANAAGQAPAVALQNQAEQLQQYAPEQLAAMNVHVTPQQAQTPAQMGAVGYGMERLLYNEAALPLQAENSATAELQQNAATLGQMTPQALEALALGIAPQQAQTPAQLGMTGFTTEQFAQGAAGQALSDISPYVAQLAQAGQGDVAEALRAFDPNVTPEMAQASALYAQQQQGLPQLQQQLLQTALGHVTPQQAASEDAQLALARRAAQTALAADPFQTGARGVTGTAAQSLAARVQSEALRNVVDQLMSQRGATQQAAQAQALALQQALGQQGLASQQLAQQQAATQGQLGLQRAQGMTEASLAGQGQNIQALSQAAGITQQQQALQAQTRLAELSGAQQGSLAASELEQQRQLMNAQLDQAAQQATQQMQLQRAGEADNLRLQAQQAAAEGNAAAAQLLNDRANQLAQTSLAGFQAGTSAGLAASELEQQRNLQNAALGLQGQTTTAELGLQQQAQVQALRLQAQQLAQQGYTAAAQLLNQEADRAAQTGIQAAGLALQGQQTAISAQQAQQQLEQQRQTTLAGLGLEQATTADQLALQRAQAAQTAYAGLYGEAGQQGLTGQQLAAQNIAAGAGLALQQQQQETNQRIQIAGLQEQAQQYRQSNQLESLLTAQKTTADMQQFFAENSRLTNAQNLNAAIQTAGMNQQDGQFLRELQQNGILQSVNQTIQMGDLLNRNELDRTQLAEEIMSNRFDSLLKANGQLAQMQLQREGLSQNARAQATDVLGIMSQLEANFANTKATMETLKAQGKSEQLAQYAAIIGGLVSAAGTFVVGKELGALSSGAKAVGGAIVSGAKAVGGAIGDAIGLGGDGDKDVPEEWIPSEGSDVGGAPSINAGGGGNGLMMATDADLQNIARERAASTQPQWNINSTIPSVAYQDLIEQISQNTGVPVGAWIQPLQQVHENIAQAGSVNPSIANPAWLSAADRAYQLALTSLNQGRT